MRLYQIYQTKEPEMLPMIVRKFRAVKTDKHGYEQTISNKETNRRWFVPLTIGSRSMATYEFELYFAESYRHYATEYVRARDNKQAKQKIIHRYPNVVKFQWDDSYA